mmetsp:Transcript_27230/g.31234  ORF Transcript_27230/g.31234 Transcript_27230/m.31234 type:complete len:257 (-) Transcript_27230:815-1585(-)
MCSSSACPLAARSSGVPTKTSSRRKPMALRWRTAKNQAAEQIPVASKKSAACKKMYTIGLLKKATGKLEATNCHAILPRIVVVMAPIKPRFNMAWTQSATPKIFSSSPMTILIVVTRAMTKKQSVTVICRPHIKPGRFFPPFLKRHSHVRKAMGDSPRSLLGILATVKKAICIPSRRPMALIKTKKRTNPTIAGRPSQIVVWPRKRASQVAANAKIKTAILNKTRPQKKTKVNPSLGGSFDSTGLPAAQYAIIRIK